MPIRINQSIEEYLNGLGGGPFGGQVNNDQGPGGGWVPPWMTPQQYVAGQVTTPMQGSLGFDQFYGTVPFNQPPPMPEADSYANPTLVNNVGAYDTARNMPIPTSPPQMPFGYGGGQAPLMGPSPQVAGSIPNGINPDTLRRGFINGGYNQAPQTNYQVPFGPFGVNPDTIRANIIAHGNDIGSQTPPPPGKDKVPPGNAGAGVGTGKPQKDEWDWARQLSEEYGVKWDVLADVYLNPARKGTWGKYGSPERDVAYAIKEAREDGVWAELFTRFTGNPPNEQEWVEHWYAKTYGYENYRDPLLTGHSAAAQAFFDQIDQLNNPEPDPNHYSNNPPPNNW